MDRTRACLSMICNGYLQTRIGKTGSTILSSHFVSALFEDGEEGVWICFHQGRLNYYSPSAPSVCIILETGNAFAEGEVILISV